MITLSPSGSQHVSWGPLLGHKDITNGPTSLPNRMNFDGNVINIYIL